MPVDHEQRRRQIAEAVTAVTAREGLDAATIRRIAAELGGPTKTLTYYFADKQELLLFTYDVLAQQYLDEARARGPTDLVGRLMAMAAIDAPSRARWRFYLAFWDRAARNPEFARLQRDHLERAVTHIGEIVRSLTGERRDLGEISLTLNAVVQGISVQTLADPDLWPPARVRAVLTEMVQTLLGAREQADHE